MPQAVFDEVQGLIAQRSDNLPHGEAQFRRLLDKLPAGAYTCDARGLITYFNPQAEQLWGRAPKLNDPVDRFCGSFKLYLADGTPVAHDRCWMALALAEKHAFGGEEIIIERPDGQRVTVLAHVHPLTDGSGAVVGAVNVIVDISDRKRTEQALVAADRRKDEFLATLAHELRNPLAPIRNAIELLRVKCPADEDLQWAVAVVDRQARQLTRLTDDLLDVARIARNKLELRKERIGLARIVEAALEASWPAVSAAGHELSVHASPEPILLDGDLTRLAQAVCNLVNNAAKYTPPGGRIWLTAEREGSDAIVRVRDNGIGIPADKMPRIFEMFAQIDDALDRSQGGLGIGLKLVKQLVELHGGTIQARSEGKGRGSEFILRLPIALAVPSAGVPVAVAEGNAALKAAPTPNGRHRILLADDNEDAAASLSRLLRGMGHEVRCARDGVEAVSEADVFRPDVVMLDIGMPRLNGLDAGRQIRQQPWARRALLIALTGWGQDDDRRKTQDAGFDEHLVKPVDLAALEKLLSTLKR